MNTKIYEALMSYSKSNKMKYNSLQCQGNFKFEGRNTYASKLIEVTVSNGGGIVSSHVPSNWFKQIQIEEEEQEAEVGMKRKISVRGPGNKDFKSLKSASKTIASKQITECV
jgi:hypothetical protein